MVDGSAPLADVEAEAARLLARATQAKVLVRLLGGAAVGMHRHTPFLPMLERRYGDVDVVVKKAQDRGLKRLLEELGYVPNRSFNNLHGDRRLLFYDERNARQLDVFIGTFRMCHALDLDNRLELHPTTLAPADLLLTKLQIVQIEEKDLLDAAALLLDLPLDGTPPGIDTARFAAPLAGDWGFHHTVERNLPKVAGWARARLADGRAEAVAASADRLRQAMEAVPKSVRWRMRARVGEKVTWYELPEETG
jgi:hypothetical protein